MARWGGFGTRREEHETSRGLDREARNRITLTLLLQRLFKDQMNVTLQISMVALLAYAGTRTSFAVCDKLYGGIYSSKRASMRRKAPSGQRRQRVGRSFDVGLVKNVVYTPAT